MENRGVTGYRIAKDTGISESLFGKWRVHPTSKIDAITVTKIADYFDVTVDELLGKEQKNKPTAESDEPKDLMDILREQEGLMFNGVPISEEDKESVIAAIKLATEIAKKSRNQ